MALINNITTDNRREDKPFPKLMQHRDGTIILFVREDVGIVVFAADNENFVGEYSETWYGDLFSDYNGTVTLSNEEC